MWDSSECNMKTKVETNMSMRTRRPCEEDISGAVRRREGILDVSGASEGDLSNSSLVGTQRGTEIIEVPAGLSAEQLANTTHCIEVVLTKEFVFHHRVHDHDGVWLFGHGPKNTS